MTRAERYQELVDGLKVTIHHQSWLGHYWGRAGAIALARARCFYLIGELGKTERDVLSSLSSTYYSASGNAWSRAKKAEILFPFWAWRAWRCLRRAVRLADQLKRSVVKLSELSGDELDVLCSILRKAKRWESALACAVVGLQRTGLSNNTRCLLYLGQAQALEKLGQDSASLSAYIQAYDLKEQVSPGTQVRLMRVIAGRWERSGHTERAARGRTEARTLALLEGFDDQLIKLGG